MEDEKPVMEIIRLDDGIQTNDACSPGDIVTPSCGGDECYLYEGCMEETGCPKKTNPQDPYQ